MRLLYMVCMAFTCAAGVSSREAAADEASVRQAIETYVKAFNAQDTETLSAMWSPNATHVDHALAERTEGRDEIISDIKAVFAEPEPVMLSGTVGPVRMVTDTVAHVSGQVMVTVGDRTPVVSQYSAVFVKDGQQWMIDMMEEYAVPQPVSAAAAISQLDWLIGTWSDSSGSGVVRSTVRLADGGSFLIRSFEVVTEAAEGEGERTSKSTQIIGWDPRAQTIRSWTFNADGSFGEGQWSKSGQQWLIKATQTLHDGQTAAGSYVLEPKSKDAFSIQLIGHEIGGRLQPSTAAVTVRREAAPDVSESTPDNQEAKDE